LLLASAYAGWAGSLPEDVVAERLDGSLRELERPPEQFVRGFIPSLLTDRAPAEMIDELVAIMSDFHPAGCRPMLHAMAEADLRDVLPRIDIPTLLLYGDADVRSPLHVAEQLHEQIPGSTLVVIPGVGHQSNIEAASLFNAAVRDFLRSN
jgi:pimeloyl-ACP methyl ester carboxylesterase